MVASSGRSSGQCPRTAPLGDRRRLRDSQHRHEGAPNITIDGERSMAQRKRRRKSRTSRQSAVAGDGTISLLRGPSKARLPGSTKAKTSRHKRRVAWFGARVTWPLREAPLAKLQAERKRVQKAMPQAAPALATAWQLAGPTNIGGRCTALVCDPANPDQRVDRRRGRRRLGEHEMPAVAGSSSGAPTDLSKSAPSPSTPRMPRPSTAAPVRRICRPTPIRATVCTGRPMAA